jgi:DNA polymerase III epsilon subunit family exonuclease
LSIFNKKIKDLKFVAFDLETTGLFPATSGILEIGAVKFTLDGEISRFESLINPQSPISHSSYLIHGINQKMVADKPVIEEVLPDFFNFLEDSVVIAHNSIFDVSFVSYNILKFGLEIPGNPVMDTRILAKTLAGDSPDYKLATLVQYFNLPSTVFHRAVFDAVYCKEVFIKLIDIISPQGEFSFEELTSINKPLNFNIMTEYKTSIDLPEIYSPIKQAIVENSKIKISYRKFDGEVSDRDITPISFLKLKNKLYLEAYCHLRGEKRTFKLSKILQFQSI